MSAPESAAGAELFSTTEGRIGTIVINRPDKRNAFTRSMWVRLGELIAQLEADAEVKVIVLRSSDSRAFSAGADIIEFRQVRTDELAARDYDEVVRKTESTLAGCAKPTIAMICGFCVGGGCELAVACDFRFAAAGSTFGITPANLGIVYSLGATKRLVDLVGPANAKLMLMSAQLFDGERALRMGLVTVLCSTSELERATYEFAGLLASKAQLTVQGAKRIVGMILDGAVTDGDESIALQREAYASDDYREGVEAFTARRKPSFS